MKTFHSMSEALPSLLKEPYYADVTKEILFALYGVEQLRAFGEEGSAVIILETDEDCRIAEEQYTLSAFASELEEHFHVGDEEWAKRVYVIDDAGDGIVSFQLVPPRAEK